MKSFRVLGMTCAAVILNACAARTSPSPSTSATPDSLLIRRDIEYLASPALAGRLTGTPGNDSAAAYIARRYAALGVKALSPGYLQRFDARPPAHNGAVETLPTQNVFGVVRGTDPALRNEYVVVGAHFDHLGTNTIFAADPRATGLRLGADDNASGSAAVLELARLIARSPTKRSVIFAHFSGEEEGTLGSMYMVELMPVPIDSVDAMHNFDRVGRMKNDRLIVFGVATSPELPSILLRAAAAAPGLRLTASGDGDGPSDHASFYLKNVPVLHFFTDSHEDYHKVGDTPDKINAAGEARVVAVAERALRAIADQATRLTFVRAPSTAKTSSSQGSNVYLGSIPDMSGSDIPGLRLSGVSAGSPAEVAGLKQGDVIVAFDGKPVKDLYEYSDALYAHRPGDDVDIVVVRNGQRVTVHVKLGRRGG
jgi:Zn-dependent M28 family amino/carboxypeptidase